MMRRCLVFCVVAVLLAGCTVGFGGSERAGLIHVIEQDSVRTVHPAAIYESPEFAKSDNIYAEPLSGVEGHAVALAQIKDREQFHVHDEHDLIVYLKGGQGVLRTRHQSVDVRPGDWTLIPRGVPHQFVTTSDRPARAVVVRTPPVEGDRRTVER